MNQKDKQFYREEEEDILNRKNKAVEKIGELLIKSIDSNRRFIMILATLSFAVGGALLTLFVNPDQNIFSGKIIVIISISSVILSALISIIYLLIIHQRENYNLSNYLEFQRAAADKIHKLIMDSIEDDAPFDKYRSQSIPLYNENRKKEKDFVLKIRKNAFKKDPWPYIITVLFVLGIIFSLISFIV